MWSSKRISQIGIVSLFGITMLWIAVTTLHGLTILASGRILPGVSTMGLALDDLDVKSAAVQIAMARLDRPVTLTDGSRTWQIKSSQLGIKVDAQATADEAQHYGRGSGSLLIGLFSTVAVPPVMTINRSVLEQGLQNFETKVDIQATSATIHLDNGTIQPVVAKIGSKLAIGTTVDQFLEAGDLTTIHLVMADVQPEVSDIGALINRARALLASPLTLNVYDPISNQKAVWSVPAAQWDPWLTTTSSGSQTIFSIQHDPFASYLRSRTFSDGRFLNVDEGVKSMQTALAVNTTSTTLRVYHPATTYQVEVGDTFYGIAMREGIPYWQILEKNPGADPNNLTVGQILNIPSKDIMLPLPVVTTKRIVVSITKQHMTVYDNNAVKWDWTASTGRDDSPTMPGVYQIKEHDQTAHSTYLNMDMPDFLSIYDAQPGFTNGIHGFPTQNGGVIWQNDLGHVITYGCVLLSSENAQLLYNWAEDGVVVEIQP